MLQNANDDLQQTWLVKDVEDIPHTNKMLLIEGQKVIVIILSSLLLTCFFGGFMICENKLFKNAENQLFTCNVTKMEYGDFYNLLAQASSVKQEMIFLNKTLRYNLSIKTELQEILETRTNQYNEMMKDVQYQKGLQRECNKIIVQKRNQFLEAQRNGYLKRFYAFQVVYLLTVAVIFIWSGFYISKFLNVKKTSGIKTVVKFVFVAVLCIHVIVIFLSIVLPTRPWIHKQYQLNGVYINIVCKIK